MYFYVFKDEIILSDMYNKKDYNKIWRFNIAGKMLDDPKIIPNAKQVITQDTLLQLFNNNNNISLLSRFFSYHQSLLIIS